MTHTYSPSFGIGLPDALHRDRPQRRERRRSSGPTVSGTFTTRFWGTVTMPAWEA